jgi:GGDEF domain-containing protein
LGHCAGDEILKKIAPDTQLTEAQDMAERLRIAIFRIVNGTYPISVSVGIAAMSEERDLLQQVDQALYRAKQAGRNCCRH